MKTRTYDDAALVKLNKAKESIKQAIEEINYMKSIRDGVERGVILNIDGKMINTSKFSAARKASMIKKATAAAKIRANAINENMKIGDQILNVKEGRNTLRVNKRSGSISVQGKKKPLRSVITGPEADYGQIQVPAVFPNIALEEGVVPLETKAYLKSGRRAVSRIMQVPTVVELRSQARKAGLSGIDVENEVARQQELWAIKKSSKAARNITGRAPPMPNLPPTEPGIVLRTAKQVARETKQAIAEVKRQEKIVSKVMKRKKT